MASFRRGCPSLLRSVGTLVDEFRNLVDHDGDDAVVAGVGCSCNLHNHPQEVDVGQWVEIEIENEGVMRGNPDTAVEGVGVAVWEAQRMKTRELGCWESPVLQLLDCTTATEYLLGAGRRMWSFVVRAD